MNGLLWPSNSVLHTLQQLFVILHKERASKCLQVLSPHFSKRQSLKFGDNLPNIYIDFKKYTDTCLRQSIMLKKPPTYCLTLRFHFHSSQFCIQLSVLERYQSRHNMEEEKASVDVDKHVRGFRKIAWAFPKVMLREQSKASLHSVALVIFTYLCSMSPRLYVRTIGVLNINSKLCPQLYLYSTSS